MRTTVDMPDQLFRELKATAAHRGVSLKTLIQMAVESEIRKGQPKSTGRIEFPVLTSLEPGSLNLTNAEIEDLLT